MILQRCKVVKTSTEDSKFQFPNMALGMELWVLPQTIDNRRYQRKGGEPFSCLTVMAKDQQQPIPVEILEFSSEFRLEGYQGT